jgi:hypothetical protein
VGFRGEEGEEVLYMREVIEKALYIEGGTFPPHITPILPYFPQHITHIHFQKYTLKNTPKQPYPKLHFSFRIQGLNHFTTT